MIEMTVQLPLALSVLWFFQLMEFSLWVNVMTISGNNKLDKSILLKTKEYRFTYPFLIKFNGHGWLCLVFGQLHFMLKDEAWFFMSPSVCSKFLCPTWLWISLVSVCACKNVWRDSSWCTSLICKACNSTSLCWYYLIPWCNLRSLCYQNYSPCKSNHTWMVFEETSNCANCNMSLWVILWRVSVWNIDLRKTFL
jgi:hypothetical protein